MKIRRPWWHHLLAPYFHWRADREAKRAAAERLARFERIGYFVYYTYFSAEKNNYRVHVFAAEKNGRNERRLRRLSAGEGDVADYAKRHHCWAIVKAWEDGDDAAGARLLRQGPHLTPEEYADARNGGAA